MNKTAKILLGFATGALAGIVTGLLLAPDKVSEKEKKSKKQEQKEEDDLPSFLKKTKDHFGCAEKEETAGLM